MTERGERERELEAIELAKRISGDQDDDLVILARGLLCISEERDTLKRERDELLSWSDFGSRLDTRPERSGWLLFEDIGHALARLEIKAEESRTITFEEVRQILRHVEKLRMLVLGAENPRAEAAERQLAELREKIGKLINAIDGRLAAGSIATQLLALLEPTASPVPPQPSLDELVDRITPEKPRE